MLVRKSFYRLTMSTKVEDKYGGHETHHTHKYEQVGNGETVRQGSRSCQLFLGRQSWTENKFKEFMFCHRLTSFKKFVGTMEKLNIGVVLLKILSSSFITTIAMVRSQIIRERIGKSSRRSVRE